jgi:hypothetical protein
VGIGLLVTRRAEFADGRAAQFKDISVVHVVTRVAAVVDRRMHVLAREFVPAVTFITAGNIVQQGAVGGVTFIARLGGVKKEKAQLRPLEVRRAEKSTGQQQPGRQEYRRCVSTRSRTASLSTHGANLTASGDNIKCIYGYGFGGIQASSTRRQYGQ